MRKLLNKIRWVTISDAAKELSASLEEDVTEADVLRLALDGHLKLSINFVNNVKARRGRFIGYENASWCEFPPEMTDKMLNTHPEYRAERTIYPKTSDLPAGQTIPFKKNLGINDDISIALDEEVIDLHAVFDLLMIGNERKDIENIYQNLMGGPVVTMQGVEGVFVHKGSEIYQLQEHRVNDENEPGSAAQLQKLKAHIAAKNIGESKAKEMLDKFKEAQMDFTSRLFTGAEHRCYFPARAIPEDGVLIVRNDELLNFVQTCRNSPNISEKELKTTERHSMLTIIAALCDNSVIDPQERGAAQRIMEMTDEIGAHVDDGTISKALKQIPDALARRKK